ncbi:hypothetical protein HIM_06315 [Hirsutella minnesotensis 3608]|uniref:Uncharacterized protein n=1 Tax=Hirsutella minnesotensis 3608 TaxID=1043627 RepID=A0A0F8A4W9_9HYPO|nr:hypothetical protein HIM_06315 [Hirsutella minnesotensis 3608]
MEQGIAEQEEYEKNHPNMSWSEALERNQELRTKVIGGTAMDAAKATMDDIEQGQTPELGRYMKNMWTGTLNDLGRNYIPLAKLYEGQEPTISEKTDKRKVPFPKMVSAAYVEAAENVKARPAKSLQELFERS